MTDLHDASIRELVAELTAVEDRLRELNAAVDCPEGRSWTAAELARLSRREQDILVSLREWRLSRVRWRDADGATEVAEPVAPE